MSKTVFRGESEHRQHSKQLLQSISERARPNEVRSLSLTVYEVMSVAPHDFGFGVTLHRDDRLIYFALLTNEAAIWSITLE